MISQSMGIDDALIGGNASADAAAAGGGDVDAVSGIDVVLAHDLQPMGYSYKSYKEYIKGYVKVCCCDDASGAVRTIWGLWVGVFVARHWVVCLDVSPLTGMVKFSLGSRWSWHHCHSSLSLGFVSIRLFGRNACRSSVPSKLMCSGARAE